MPMLKNKHLVWIASLCSAGGVLLGMAAVSDRSRLAAELDDLKVRQAQFDEASKDLGARVTNQETVELVRLREDLKGLEKGLSDRFVDLEKAQRDELKSLKDTVATLSNTSRQDRGQPSREIKDQLDRIEGLLKRHLESSVPGSARERGPRDGRSGQGMRRPDVDGGPPGAP